MASDLTHAETLPAPAQAPPTQQGPRLATPHRRRLVFIYSILAAVLAAAITGVVVYAGRSIHPAPAWSSWKPSGGGLGASKQIAEHVGAAYRLPNGDQLVDVIAKTPSVSPADQQIPIHFVAFRGAKGKVGQVIAVSPTDSVMYSLCGLGSSCAIATGKPSVQRGSLVRREILELALYTFKYVGGIHNVIAFMPPTPGTPPKYAVYLSRGDLSQQLKVPLVQTLSKKVPLPSTITRREQATIDRTTESRVYQYSLAQTQQGDAVLVLNPLPAS